MGGGPTMTRQISASTVIATAINMARASPVMDGAIATGDTRTARSLRPWQCAVGHGSSVDLDRLGDRSGGRIDYMPGFPSLSD